MSVADTAPSINAGRIIPFAVAPLMAGPEAHPLLRVCNGALMYGPPGTGKTLLARWTAARMGESGGAFFAAGDRSKYERDFDIRDVPQSLLDYIRQADGFPGNASELVKNRAGRVGPYSPAIPVRLFAYDSRSRQQIKLFANHGWRG